MIFLLLTLFVVVHRFLLLSRQSVVRYFKKSCNVQQGSERSVAAKTKNKKKHKNPTNNATQKERTIIIQKG